MFDLTKLPEKILNKTTDLPWTYDKTGESKASILLFDKMVLKIEKINRSSVNESKLFSWLKGKLSISKIIESETQNGYSFLLMSRLPGEMACSDNNMRNIEDTVKALASSLKMLWQIDKINCPCLNRTSEKLIQAKYNIDNDLVDMDDFNSETLLRKDLWTYMIYIIILIKTVRKKILCFHTVIFVCLIYLLMTVI